MSWPAKIFISFIVALVYNIMPFFVILLGYGPQLPSLSDSLLWKIFAFPTWVYYEYPVIGTLLQGMFPEVLLAIAASLVVFVLTLAIISLIDILLKFVRSHE